jgi:2-oxoglutarate dehydrogenase E2 component (dihydrolipoamide succinyltransferase)
VSIEVKVPQLPESVTDATLISWHRKAGEAVRRDENLVDLETDKVVLEVPAPSDGVLKEIRIADGATVTSGEVLAVLEPGGAGGQADPESAKEAPATDGGGTPAGRTSAAAGGTSAAESSGAANAAASGTGPAGGAAAGSGSADAAAGSHEGNGSAGASGSALARDRDSADRDGARERLGPAVRNLIEEHDLDPGDIVGTGRDGRIRKADVLDFLSQHRDTDVGIDGEAPEEPAERTVAGRGEQRVAMTRLRARIAERLVDAQRTAAMLTTFNEVDMSEVVALRKRYQDQFVARYDIKLGFMSFFVRASIEALRQFPLLNASVDGSDIVYHEYFDIGVAVSTDRGLVVPVLRDAHTMSFAEIELAIRDYGTRARSGSLGMEDLTGGTFTITNGGIFGSLMSTPILNPPQSGILGMHKIQDRPMVVNGEVAVRPMMYLALTYDHRIVDGREAVQFLMHLKEQIEDPARLVLQI